MAQGTVTIFDEAKLAMLNGSLDVSDATDWSVILITTLPTASQATPDTADFTECTNGGGYTTGGIDLATVLTEAAGTVKYDDTVNPSWTAAAGSPTDIVAALIVSETLTPNALGFVDLTTDGGTTAVSLVAGDVTITWHADGIFTLA